MRQITEQRQHSRVLFGEFVRALHRVGVAHLHVQRVLQHEQRSTHLNMSNERVNLAHEWMIKGQLLGVDSLEVRLDRVQTSAQH